MPVWLGHPGSVCDLLQTQPWSRVHGCLEAPRRLLRTPSVLIRWCMRQRRRLRSCPDVSTRAALAERITRAKQLFPRCCLPRLLCPCKLRFVTHLTSNPGSSVCQPVPAAAHGHHHDIAVGTCSIFSLPQCTRAVTPRPRADAIASGGLTPTASVQPVLKPDVPLPHHGMHRCRLLSHSPFSGRHFSHCQSCSISNSRSADGPMPQPCIPCPGAASPCCDLLHLRLLLSIYRQSPHRRAWPDARSRQFPASWSLTPPSTQLSQLARSRVAQVLGPHLCHHPCPHQTSEQPRSCNAGRPATPRRCWCFHVPLCCRHAHGSTGAKGVVRLRVCCCGPLPQPTSHGAPGMARRSETHMPLQCAPRAPPP